jgi:large subunit ribosomal protein L25
MEVGKLTVHLRKDTGKGESRKLRGSGLVPGVCYGANLSAPLSIVVNPKELKASLDPAKGRNTVITVTVQDGGSQTAQLTAMLWEYQIDALRRNVTHVDLISIDPNKVIEVAVPIELVGQATSASSARSCSSRVCGWRCTNDLSSFSSNVFGAIHMHAPQTMQLSST